VDIREVALNAAPNGRILIEGESELNVLSGDVLSVVPLRLGFDVKEKHERVSRPVPSIGQLRSKTFFVVRVEVGPYVSEIIVDLLSDLLGLSRDGRRREQGSRIVSCGDHKRSTDLFSGVTRGLLAARQSQENNTNRNASGHDGEGSDASRVWKALTA